MKLYSEFERIVLLFDCDTVNVVEHPDRRLVETKSRDTRECICDFSFIGCKVQHILPSQYDPTGPMWPRQARQHVMICVVWLQKERSGEEMDRRGIGRLSMLAVKHHKHNSWKQSVALQEDQLHPFTERQSWDAATYQAAKLFIFICPNKAAAHQQHSWALTWPLCSTPLPH